MPKRVQIEVLWVDSWSLYKLDSYAFAWLEQHVLSSSGPKDMAVSQDGVRHLARRNLAWAIPLHGLRASAQIQA